ncbi:MAG: hypothetical protein DRI57_01080 [Deltaproteobacteria bacterium]|nr:MAG: hypothetical protein DRI57_01080 [Deltaproteobacteria bacterium]
MSNIKQQIVRVLPERLSEIVRMMIHPDRRGIFLLKKYGIRYAPKLSDFPPMVMIDTTTRCNLACNHCPSSVLSKDENWGGDMDFGLYKKIIDEIAHENPSSIVRPFNSGEPLLRKDMEKMIRYAKDKGVKYVSINTNGTLLNEKRAYKILDSGLDHIEFSMDAFSEETYKLIKNVNFYQKVVDNLERLIRLKESIRPDFKINVSFVKQQDNHHECEVFQAYWENKVDQVTIREYHQHGGLVDAHGRYRELNNKYRHPCPYLWERVIVQHNGKVRFCESDWKAEHAVWNVYDQTLKEIWHSDEYQKLRNEHIRGSFDHPFCKQCTDWKVIG